MLGTVKEEKFEFRNLNFRLITYVLLLSVIGVLVVHSATVDEVSKTIISTTTKQVIGIFVSLILMCVFAFINYRKVTKFAWIFYVLSILSLIYVLVFAGAISGAKRWIYIPLLGTIQPSEFAKPALLLFLAFVIFKMKDKINKLWCILLYFLAAAPVLLLVLKEPDLSTSIVLIMLTITMLFFAGISYKWVVGVLLALLPFVIFFFIAVYQEGQPILNKMFEEHQVLRINAFFFPEDFPNQVYQQNNSVMAIGSGGLFGKGLENASLYSVKNGNFLSEEQCDFIFAVIGEELGFAGSLVVIILLILVVVECFLTAKKCQDTIGKILACGVGTTIGVQSFINIAVATLLIPNTGIPLPFVSAGLSSLISTYIMVGIVLSVGLWGRLKRRVFYS